MSYWYTNIQRREVNAEMLSLSYLAQCDFSNLTYTYNVTLLTMSQQRMAIQTFPYIRPSYLCY